VSYKTYQFHMPAAAISACITGFLQNGEQHIGLLNISGLLEVHCLNMGLGIWCNVVEMKRSRKNYRWTPLEREQRNLSTLDKNHLSNLANLHHTISELLIG